MAAPIVAVGNLKGGTGKSTLAVNLACTLALGGKLRVILVDADAQGTGVEWGVRGHLPVKVEALPFDAEAGRRRVEAHWLENVNKLASDCDCVVLDLPPHLNASIDYALVAATLFVVPVTPSGADLKATARALELLRQARQVRGDGKPACLLVPSRVDRRTAAGREIEAALHDLGEPVAPAIGQRAAHIDAFTAGEWIGAYAPHSAAHTEIEALAALVRRKIR
jgi:chromosome partitioning protein